MAPFNHFDLIAPYYDRLIQPADAEEFGQRLALPASGWLLDVGGGTGQKSMLFLQKVKGIVISDSSMGMLAQARQKAGMQTICSEAEELPYQDATFERVMMVDALHHVADYRVTAGEMWRVLKPGGRIVIEEPDIRTGAVKVMAAFEKIALMRSHFISPARIAALFEHPNAKIGVEIDGTTAWIMVEKLAV